MYYAVGQNEGNTVGRRGFINVFLSVTGLAWLGSILYPVFRYLNPPDLPEANISSLKVGKLDDIAFNSGQIVKFGRTPVLLLRDSEGELRALHAVCTHLDCIVQYQPEKEVIWCACHGGVYDTYGKNISGPPPRPLEPFAVNIVNGEVFVAKGGA